MTGHLDIDATAISHLMTVIIVLAVASFRKALLKNTVKQLAGQLHRGQAAVLIKEAIAWQ